jgi:hypothetical protein
MRNRIAAIVAAATLTLGAVTMTALPAFASTGSGNQYMDEAYGSYANAWGSGPLIKSELSPTDYNDFTVETNADGDKSLVSTPGSGSPYDGDCVSDDGNSSTDAKAALNGCSGSVPWGGNLTVVTSICPSGYEAFYDGHWSGYLGVGSEPNGSQFYLNVNGANTSEVCFQKQGAE